ncbi:MAG TPA: PEP/pyruvate-binding domain-containing protein, partial [Thermoanaerobaculia bacterium]|nr:PEP/pyruvate-binding domain-containing protein [Thermoanaerobaculia bacterium]
MSQRYVFPFGGDGAVEGKPDKSLLGGKGAGLAEMSQLGIPVPPGFTISTEICRFYQQNDGNYPAGLEDEVAQNLARVEREHGKTFGNGKDPLLVSVRSGAPVSMPGMMDTILNLGLNDEIIEEAIAAGADSRFLCDCYRRLLSMYGDVVLKVPHSEFEKVLEETRDRQGVETDAELSSDALLEVISAYKAKIAEHGKPFPTDPKEQLWGAITAVFESWDNRRAREYRRLQGLSNDMGTAVNVQVMVFGNRGDDCATGVAFSRNPATGEKGIFGEYLINAQGEDVVAGIRTPQSITPEAENGGMSGQFAPAYRILEDVCRKLEKERRDMQDVEFTVDGGRLYMLQTRNGKRTGFAAVRIAVDMVDEGLIESSEAVLRVEPEQLSQLLAPVFDLDQKKEAIDRGDRVAEGLPAGPGAASGRIALSAERAAEMATEGSVILVRAETSPEDIVGMHAAAGI